MKDLGVAKKILGMKIIRDNEEKGTYIVTGEIHRKSTGNI
jgi:hypothetical protein